MRKTLLGTTTVVGGVLGFIILMWTPKTVAGFLTYAALFIVLVIVAGIMVSQKRVECSHDGSNDDK